MAKALLLAGLLVLAVAAAGGLGRPLEGRDGCASAAELHEPALDAPKPRTQGARSSISTRWGDRSASGTQRCCRPLLSAFAGRRRNQRARSSFRPSSPPALLPPRARAEAGGGHARHGCACRRDDGSDDGARACRAAHGPPPGAGACRRAGGVIVHPACARLLHLPLQRRLLSRAHTSVPLPTPTLQLESLLAPMAELPVVGRRLSQVGAGGRWHAATQGAGTPAWAWPCLRSRACAWPAQAAAEPGRDACRTPRPAHRLSPLPAAEPC